jgi:hypothetical protein
MPPGVKNTSSLPPLDHSPTLPSAGEPVTKLSFQSEHLETVRNAFWRETFQKGGHH